MTARRYFSSCQLAMAATSLRLYCGNAFAQAAAPAKVAAPSAAVNLNQTVNIAWLDSLRGLRAAVSTNQLKSFRFMAERFTQKNKAGVKFEIIGIDNKLRLQETTNALKSAIDQGARYVVQGHGAGPALAIIDALSKYNERIRARK